jgi:phosphonatase-like hydrolase
MIRMVVFDMAGTTINEDNVVYKTLRQAINEAGFDCSLDEVLQEGAGKEKLQAIKSILKTFAGREDDALANTIYTRFAGLLSVAYDALDILPQPHAVELFTALHQKEVLVVLNTGYNAPTAQSLLNKLGWQKGTTIDGLITATDVQNNRPHPDMIILAMQQFGISSGAEVVKVGDSIIDIEEGRNARCALSIGITTGAHSFEQLQSAKPDFIIHDLMELLPIIEKGA